jgi:hypothetical protein
LLVDLFFNCASYLECGLFLEFALGLAPLVMMVLLDVATSSPFVFPL